MFSAIQVSATGLWPTTRVVLVVAPLALASAGLMGLLVGRLRTRHDIATPYTRKLFHVAIFSLAAGVHAVGGTPAVLVFGGIVALVVLYAAVRGEGYPLYEALARPGDAPHRTLFVLVPLLTTALGGLLSSLLFGPHALVGYLVAGWGDALGEPVGTRWGRHRFRVPSLGGVRVTRSLEGSAAVLLGGTLAAFLGLIASGTPADMALRMALAAGVAGALVEAISTHGLDNLTVQLGAAGAAFLIGR
jgi:phytol kinase